MRWYSSKPTWVCAAPAYIAQHGALASIDALAQHRCSGFRHATTGKAMPWEFKVGEEITIILKNGEGAYVADDDTLRRLEDADQVVFRYVGNPNGSMNDIAGVTNERGNVVGLMPHPEHSVEELTASTTDGRRFFESLQSFLSATLARS